MVYLLMELQWYPGHMTKAMRMMRAQIAPVDLLIELIDARIPRSSRNPDIAALSAGKKTLLVLNKADLADEEKTRAWLHAFDEARVQALSMTATKTGSEKPVLRAIERLMEEKTAKDNARGKRAEIRAMVCGIPNVGKSAFINRLAERALTKTENRPGVTRGQQWIAVSDHIRLLDTPGVLWPKFDDVQTGERLALTGAINDGRLDAETLSLRLISFLEERYPGALAGFYGYGEETVLDCMEEEQTGLRETGILAAVAKKRGCIRSGGRPDYEKAAVMLLTDFRNGRTGRFTLDQEIQQEEISGT